MKKAIAVFVLCAVVMAFADNPHITRLVELIDVAISTPADGDVLTYDASSGKWNNKPVAVVDGPKIVARFDQDGILSGTQGNLLFTPAVAGVYRITEIVGIPDGQSGQTQVPMFDSTPFQIQGGGGGNTNDINGFRQNQQVDMIYLQAGDSITFDTTGMQYPLNLHLVVEKL